MKLNTLLSINIYIFFHALNSPVHSFVHTPTGTSVRRVNTEKSQLRFPDGLTVAAPPSTIADSGSAAHGYEKCRHFDAQRRHRKPSDPNTTQTAEQVCLSGLHNLNRNTQHA